MACLDAPECLKIPTRFVCPLIEPFERGVIVEVQTCVDRQTDNLVKDTQRAARLLLKKEVVNGVMRFFMRF